MGLETGRIFIITGPSGTGKDAIFSHLLHQYPHIRRIVTDAARQPRNGEINGVDYNFVSPRQFQQNITDGIYAEYVPYGGGKATKRTDLLQVLNGQSVFWRIDPSRATEIQAFYQDKFSPIEAEVLTNNTQVLYIGTERLTILKDRFFARDPKASRTDFLKRIREDWTEWQKYEVKMEHGTNIRYSLLINLNGQLDTTLTQATEIVARSLS